METAQQPNTQAPQKSTEQIAVEKMLGTRLMQPEQADSLDAPDVEAAVEDQAQPEGEAAETQQATETEEVEFEDFKLELPKDRAQKVKEALMRNADYTRKTKETAERERVISARESAFNEQAQFHRAVIDDIAALKSLDAQLEQFKGVQWHTLGTEDMMRTKLYYDQIREQRQKAVEILNQKQQMFGKKMAELMKQIEQSTYQEVTLKISGFNEKAKDKLKEYVKEKGYTEAEASRLFLNPRDVEIIWKAQQYDALQASKPQIQNRANGAPPVVKPGASSKPMSEDTKTMLAMRKTTDPRQKERLAGELLARKMKF